MRRVSPLGRMAGGARAVESVSHLLSRVTGWATYVPDVAGMQMFTAHFDGPHLDAVMGGVTMAAWTVTLVTIAAFAFAWHDA